MSRVAPTGLFSEKGPFVLTVILAAVGWGLTHIVDRIADTPTVEYSIAISPDNATATSSDPRKVTVRLRNLSLKQAFYGTQFILGQSRGSTIAYIDDMMNKNFAPAVVATDPVWFGQPDHAPRAIDPSPDHIDFNIPQLPPEGEVRLVAYFNGAGQPRLKARLDSSSMASMRLVPRSAETFIARNESRLILLSLSALAVWFLVVWQSHYHRLRWFWAPLAVVATVALFIPSLSYGQSGGGIVLKRVQVIDYDSNTGIPRRVHVLSPENKQIFDLYVDKNGAPQPPPKTCAPDSRLAPDLGSVYIELDEQQPVCAPNVTLHVRNVQNMHAQNDQRHSESAQINAGNVSMLQVAWTMSTGLLRGHEGSPLVIGDTMYVTTPIASDTYAINLADRTLRWEYAPKQDPDVVPVMCCDTASRGLASGDGKIFLQQSDTTLVALDAKTGKPVWTAKNGNPKIGETNANAPQVFKDKVLTGISGGEFGVRGRLYAYDIKTGKLVWQAYNSGTDAEIMFDPAKTMTWTNGKVAPVGKDSSIKTWQGDQYKLGDGTTSGWYSYDPKLNLVYYGSGSFGTSSPSQQSGDNKWSMTIFARDLDTGAAKWVDQISPLAAWGFHDINAAPLVDLTIKGKKVPALVPFDRSGIGYTLNRETGELLAAHKYDQTINWRTGIDMKTGRPFQVEHNAGRPDASLTLTMFPTPHGNGGAGDFVAWDAAAGRIVWSKREPFAVLPGALTTAGGIAFYGTTEGYIKAVSAKDGQDLWKFKTPSGIAGNVFTYEYAGKQYIGVYSGIGGWAQGTLLVFALPH